MTVGTAVAQQYANNVGLLFHQRASRFRNAAAVNVWDGTASPRSWPAVDYEWADLIDDLEVSWFPGFKV